MRWMKSGFTVFLYAIVLVAHSQPNDSMTVEVFADKTFQATSFQVLKGETYELAAHGEWQDADFPATDANGFKGFTAPMFFGMLLKPMPSQHYMRLCGKVKGWKFSIGTATTVKMKRTGELKLFANDTRGFFQNNSGSLVVSIKHTKEDSRVSRKPKLLSDGTFVPRNADAPFGRKMWRGGLLVHGFEAVGFGTLAALPSDISGWQPDVFKSYGANMKRAWTKPPVFDADKWYINYIGHPYQGTFFYNAVRSQNATIWQSSLFCMGQVFLWEYVIEASVEQPSIQDLIVTPIAGIALGELVHYGTMKMARNGLKWYEAVIVTIINPMFILNNGYRFQRVPSDLTL